MPRTTTMKRSRTLLRAATGNERGRRAIRISQVSPLHSGRGAECRSRHHWFRHRVIRFAAVLAVESAPAATDAADLGRRLVPPSSIGFKHAYYDVATGKLEALRPGDRMRGGPRVGDRIWGARRTEWPFVAAGNCLQTDPDFGQTDELLMDWMDIPARSRIGGFTFAYATDATSDPNALVLTILFQNDANGFNNNTGDFVAGFEFAVPGTTHFPYAYIGWVITIDLESAGLEFTYGDRDLDDDGLADTGYYYGFLGPDGYGDSSLTGPLLMQEPNDPLYFTGAEDYFDLYARDPNHPCADPDAPFSYVDTLSFEGPQNQFTQFALALYATRCPQAGCDYSDVDGDCVVGLEDLSRLLSAYGCCAADACFDEAADLAPPRCVNITDLSLLLRNYGVACN